MLIAMYLRGLAKQVQEMVQCDDVHFYLKCPDAALRHPFLAVLSQQLQSNTSHTEQECAWLLRDDRIHALYDIALQTGRLCTLSAPLHSTFLRPVRSIALAPLESAHGVLGCLICTDSQEGSFSSALCLLLEQSLPAITRQVENLLHEVLYVHSAYRQPLSASESTDALLGVHEQSELISLVNHELRVPLTAIKGYAGLLQEYSLPDEAHEKAIGYAAMTPERQRHYLGSIMEQIRHLEVLVHDLHDVSRLRSGRLALRRSQLDIAHLCQRIAQQGRQYVAQEHSSLYTIHCHTDPDLPLVWADPDRVEQVLTNLIENAVKYSPDGGRIDILVSTVCPEPLLETQASGDAPGIVAHEVPMVYITVRDWGIGIPLQQQATVFQPFKRGEQPEAEHVAGSGLGLYLARTLIEAMHGKISLTSGTENGTHVTFSLPTMPGVSMHSAQSSRSTCNRSQRTARCG